MKDKNKKILYISLLTISLLTFILQIFVFNYPDGIIGLIICIFSIYLSVGSIIKLCRLSKKFKSTLGNIIDLLFWMP